MPSPTLRSALRLSAYALACVGVAFAVWTRGAFGPVTIDQVLWHVRYAEGSAVHMGGIFLVEFLVEVLAIPLVIAVVLTLAHVLVAPHCRGWHRAALHSLAPIATCGAVCALALQLSVPAYAAAYFEPDLFAHEYVDPARVALAQKAHRRNLVLIYAESLESTYGDAHLFGHDLLAPLRHVGGRSYARYRPASGATWTIAAMVATQCGVPLKVYSESDVRRREGSKSFLPGATCLGDLLHAHGYRSVFLGGANLDFSGKGRFLSDHGYDETWGRDEWQKAGAPAQDFNVWGMYDSALFARGRKTLERLHAAHRPFNLTMLTMDTHNPRGFLSPECRREGADRFEGIVSCTAQEIADFVQFARNRGFLEDTTIVVIGDHLAVPNPVYAQLEEAGERRGIFNLVVGENLPPANRDELLSYDLLPTLVELAGMHVPGERLGLGYSAVGPSDVAPPEREREAEWSVAALKESPAYDELWDAAEPVVAPAGAQPEPVVAAPAD
jgi:phosphoglycerol transferase